MIRNYSLVRGIKYSLLIIILFIKKMKKNIVKFSLILCISILVFSCKNTKDVSQNTPKENTEPIENVDKESEVLENDLETVLEGLHLLSFDELENQHIMIDGQSMPVYDSNGNKLEGMELVSYFQSGDFKPDIYGNDSGLAKAVVMVEMTEEEKEAIKMEMEMMEADRDKLANAIPFDATSLKGEKFNYPALKGKVIVMNFWFIACKPCQKEIPELNELQAKYADNEDVVFVSFAKDSPESLQAFLKETTFNYPVIPRANTEIREYFVSGFPTNFVIDKEGKIIYEAKGYRHDIGKIIEGKIEEALR